MRCMLSNDCPTIETNSYPWRSYSITTEPTTITTSSPTHVPTLAPTSSPIDVNCAGYVNYEDLPSNWCNQIDRWALCGIGNGIVSGSGYNCEFREDTGSCKSLSSGNQCNVFQSDGYVESTQWSCQSGQTASGPAYAYSADNSEATCGAACDADSLCYAFDYTTRSTWDSCRLVQENYHASARLGSGGGDNRMYCSPESAEVEVGKQEEMNLLLKKKNAALREALEMLSQV